VPAEPEVPASADARAQTGLAEHYEQLRAAALGGGADGWRLGLGVLAGKGVTGWIRAWTSCPGPTPAPSAPSSEGAPPAAPAAPAATGSRRPPGPETEPLVRVLAAMALAHA
jgi:hypothetical protein